LHGFAGQDEFSTLCGRSGDERFEGRAEIAPGEGAIDPGMAEIAAADQRENTASAGLGGDGGEEDVSGLGAGHMILDGGVRPGFFVFEILDGVVEFGFESLLPGGVDGGVDVEAALLDGGIVEDAVELTADGLEGVTGLGVARIILGELERLGGDGIAAGLVDETHGDHAGESLRALVEGFVGIAQG
jgi:hypothetical protein